MEGSELSDIELMASKFARALLSSSKRIEELEKALRGLLEGVHGDGYVLPAGAIATQRARAALSPSNGGGEMAPASPSRSPASERSAK